MTAPFGLLLAPGAGANSDSPALLAVEAALGPDWVVRRMDFPYRRAGRKAPDRVPVLIEALRQEAEDFATATGFAAHQIFLGGRSMGGRIASMAVAEGLAAAGLLLLSYPLHPPDRPEKLRVEHFPAIAVPCCFVSGTRDAFGRPDEFASHLDSIAGPVDVQWIEGGDHAMKNKDDLVAEAARAWLTDQVGE